MCIPGYTSALNGKLNWSLLSVCPSLKTDGIVCDLALGGEGTFLGGIWFSFKISFQDFVKYLKDH